MSLSSETVGPGHQGYRLHRDGRASRLEYLQMRDNPLRFVIKPRHAIEAIERVVSENGGYAVVEKHEAEADLIDMDPRSGTGG